MQFKTVNKFVSNIIEAIQNTGISAVKALKENTFSTKIVNFPKNQKVSGKVSVSNQPTKDIRKLKKILLEFQSTVAKKKYPKSIKVSNFPRPVKPKDFPKSFEVSNFPKKINIGNTKDLTTVRVKNQPSKELKELSDQLESVGKLIKELKLDPTINVAPSEIPDIIVPEPNVTVEQQEINLDELSAILTQALYTKDPKEYLSVRLSNGDKFYEAISELTTISSSGSSSTFADASGNPTRAMIDSNRRVVTASEDDWSLNDTKIDSGDSNITYLGQENSIGHWRMVKVIEDGEETTMRYATVENNDDVDGYVNALNDRESLTYTIASLS